MFGTILDSQPARESLYSLRKEVYCKVCQWPLLYKSNTASMIVHLQSHHSAVYSETADQLKTESAHLSLASLPKDQLSIRDSFKKLTPLPRSSSRWKALTNSVCYFLAKDLHPLSTVNDKRIFTCLRNLNLDTHLQTEQQSLDTTYLNCMQKRGRKFVNR